MFGTFTQMHDRWLEPEEEKVYGFDYKSDELYEGDEGWLYDGDIIRDDDVEDWAIEFLRINATRMIVGEEQ